MSGNPIRIETVELIAKQEQEIGWFPEIEVAFSFWHGGQMLKEGVTLCWRNESVLQDARLEGERMCHKYGIGADSTLELAAFRYDREVVRVQSTAGDRHWHSPENDRGFPRNKLISCGLIWSSQYGDLPLNAQSPSRRFGFTKTIPIAGPECLTADPSNHFFVGLKTVDQSALLNGLVIIDGSLGNLQFRTVDGGTTEQREPLLQVSGEITAALNPRCVKQSWTILSSMIEQDVDVVVWPAGRQVHWDTTRLCQENITWQPL